MGIRVIVEFLQETTLRIMAYIYDDDGDAVSPTTSTTVTVVHSDGTVLIDEKAMTEDDTGVFSYYKQTDSDTPTGRYIGKVVGIDGTGDSAYTSVGTFSFKIKTGINL